MDGVGRWLRVDEEDRSDLDHDLQYCLISAFLNSRSLH